MDHELMRARLTESRIARLATVTANGSAHVVPCCFVVDADRIFTAVDDVKAKSTAALRRLDNVVAHATVSLLVDHYEDDWTALWWVRVDGTGSVSSDDGAERTAALGLLAAKYDQYRDHPPPGPLITIAIDSWHGWSATT